MKAAEVSRSLLHGINKLRLACSHCDAILVVNEHSIPAHKVVLAAASDLLHSIFTTAGDSGVYQLSGVQTADFLRVLDFIYTGQIQLDRSNISSTKTIAEQLKIELLVKACDQFVEFPMCGANSEVRSLSNGVGKNGETRQKFTRGVRVRKALGKSVPQCKNKRSEERQDSVPEEPSEMRPTGVDAEANKTGDMDYQQVEPHVQCSLPYSRAQSDMLQSPTCLQGTSMQTSLPKSCGMVSTTIKNLPVDIGDYSKDEDATEAEAGVETGEKGVDSAAAEAVMVHSDAEEPSSCGLDDNVCSSKTTEQGPTSVPLDSVTCERNARNSDDIQVRTEKSPNSETANRRDPVTSLDNGVSERKLRRKKSICQTCASGVSEPTGEHGEDEARCSAEDYKRKQYLRSSSCENVRCPPVIECTGGAPVSSQYFCPLCSYWSVSLPAVVEHYRKGHMSTEAQGGGSTSKTPVCEHQELIRANKHPECYECGTCPFATTKRHTYKRHVQIKHGRKVTCSVCSKAFKNVLTLKQHVECVHSGTVYKCSLCDYTSRYLATLHRHQYRQHHVVSTATGRIYRCQFCAYSHVTLNFVRKHQRTCHSDETPYKCAHCPKAFKRPENRNEHEQTHSSERAFHCGSCDYACHSKSNLAKHLRHSHSAERPFACDFCGFRTKARSNLKQHSQRCQQKCIRTQDDAEPGSILSHDVGDLEAFTVQEDVFEDAM